MPPDINAGPPTLAAGTPGRAGGPTTAGPPGGDPLAALFASLLASSGGPALAKPPTGAAFALLKVAPKPGTASQPTALLKPNAAPTEDKTQAKASSAALPTSSPILLAPIQMRPFLPPTAGVTAGPKATEQKTTEKTMDTSPAPALPSKDKADGTGGELPLPGQGVNTSAAPAPSPALLITMQAPPAAPFAADRAVADRIAASSDPQGQMAAAPSLPAVSQPPPQVVPDVSPGTPTPAVFAFDVAAPAAAPGVTPQPAVAASPRPVPAAGVTTQSAPVAAPGTVDAAPDLTKQPQVVQAVAAQEASTLVAVRAAPLGLPVAPRSSVSRGAAATNGSTVTDGRTAKDGKVARDGGIPMEGRGTTEGKAATEGGTTRDGQAARDGGGTTDGQNAMEGGGATDGRMVTDGQPAKEGEPAKEGGISTESPAATDGQPARDGGSATDGKVLMAAGTPKTGLKSVAPPADTITRVQAAGLQAPVVDKPSGRNAQSAGGETPVPLPMPLPTQAGAAGVEAKPLSAADRTEVVRQVAEAVSAMPPPAKPGASEQMTLQLHPKEWGQLQVSVTVTPGTTPGAAQAVTAHVVTQNPQVKAALENQSGDLRQALREAGLHLDKISVTVQRMDASAQTGTATSGGRHEASQGGADQGRVGQGMGGAFGGTTPDQKTGTSDAARTSDGTGMSSASGNGMSGAASGGSPGGRQGGQPPTYAAAYAPAEPEDAAPLEMSRRPASGQVDMRA